MASSGAEDVAALKSVDGILVISLDRRPDRWAAFQGAWADRLPWDRLERLSAVDGQQLRGFGEKPWFRGRARDRVWAGRAGCTLSHRKAMLTARERGWSRVLILEDDATPAADVPCPAVVSEDAWDLLYLGGREPEGPFGEARGGAVRIHGALDTHAYIANARVRDWMIEHLPDEAGVWAWVARERAVDRWMRREIGRPFRVMISRPQFAVQADDVSDITERRDRAYASEEAVALARPFRNASEVRRAGEIVSDRVRAGLKALVGF